MITILRLSHRRERDKRVTTHLALVARAFGADSMIYSGDKDSSLESSVMDVVSRWGGNFKINHTKNWKSEISRFKGKKVHLTMYGINIDNVISRIREEYNQGNDILVVVGGEKVPGEVYQMVDYNVAIGNQPHSEISALAIFLDRLFQGKELEKEFENWKIRIIPQNKGKRVETR